MTQKQISNYWSKIQEIEETQENDENYFKLLEQRAQQEKENHLPNHDWSHDVL